jgi:uncharacterized protein YbaA (DUF1428 family)
MAYIDGYVIAVPTAKKAEYKELAKSMMVIFKDHGAQQVTECWGDDVPPGKVTSFPMAVKCQDDETVVFSWIVWPSKEIRVAGMKKAMEDPRMKMDPATMPFDGKRMIFGGFEVLVQG